MPTTQTLPKIGEIVTVTNPQTGAPIEGKVVSCNDEHHRVTVLCPADNPTMRLENIAEWSNPKASAKRPKAGPGSSPSGVKPKAAKRGKSTSSRKKKHD